MWSKYLSEKDIDIIYKGDYMPNKIQLEIAYQLNRISNILDDAHVTIDGGEVETFTTIRR